MVILFQIFDKTCDPIFHLFISDPILVKQFQKNLKFQKWKTWHCLFWLSLSIYCTFYHILVGIPQKGPQKEFHFKRLVHVLRTEIGFPLTFPPCHPSLSLLALPKFIWWKDQLEAYSLIHNQHLGDILWPPNTSTGPPKELWNSK